MLSAHRRPLTLALAAILALAARGTAQPRPATGGHVVVVKLIERPGDKPFAFDPAVVTVERGDTVRFTEAAGTMHNVRFTKVAPGAHLGSATSGPYLTTKGQTYDVVIDKRFALGAYEYVCDPHAAIGMKGTLVVKSPDHPAGSDR